MTEPCEATWRGIPIPSASITDPPDTERSVETAEAKVLREMMGGETYTFRAKRGPACGCHPREACKSCGCPTCGSKAHTRCKGAQR